MREFSSARPAVVAVAIALLVGAALVATEFAAGGVSPHIEAVSVWSDSVDAPPGMVYYLLDVNVSNGGPSAWNLDPSLFSVTSNASISYPRASSYNATAVLESVSIGSGRHLAGEVAFELPAGQVPSKLNYHDSKVGVSVQAPRVPAVSGVASRFDPSVHFDLNGTSWAGTIATWAAISNQSSALYFFSGEEGQRNDRFVFFTGQKIDVSFAFYYYKGPMDPNTIEIKSIKSDDGYAVSDVLALRPTFGFSGYGGPSPLPVTMTGYGSNIEVTLLATVPPGPQYGVLHFTVQFADG